MIFIEIYALSTGFLLLGIIFQIVEDLRYPHLEKYFKNPQDKKDFENLRLKKQFKNVILSFVPIYNSYLCLKSIFNSLMFHVFSCFRYLFNSLN